MNTICAIATAQGGAIGIIRVSGPQAINITNTIFTKDITNAQGYTLHYGHIIPPSPITHRPSPTNDPSPITKHPSPIDQVLLTIFRAPHSYTGEDSVEISCHGSGYILHTILALLITQGCQLAQPGEFTKRAFLNGKLDLSQAEAVADLIASQNEAQHRVAMTQLRGGISTKLSELRAQLLHLTTLLELELDFSEHEELQFADRTELLNIAQQIQHEITHLINSFQQGNAIKNGIPVAIIGAPNVGKSTLLNQLLQDDKAIVSNIAGTTRDTIEDTINIDGVLFRFIDTAGIRETSDAIEALGIERSIKAIEKAQIIILMRDPDNDYPEIEEGQNQTIIRIYNKSKEFQAINGIGLQWLKSELGKAVPQQSDNSVLVTNLRHKQSLDLALDDISRTIDSLNHNISGDIISEDLRQCILHLGEILGDISDNEILGNIFKNFCIGK